MKRRPPREAFPDSIDPEIVAQVQRRLDAFERGRPVDEFHRLEGELRAAAGRSRATRRLIAENAAVEIGAAPLEKPSARFIEGEFELGRARRDFEEGDAKAWAQRFAEDFFIAQLRRSEIGGFG